MNFFFFLYELKAVFVDCGKVYEQLCLNASCEEKKFAWSFFFLHLCGLRGRVYLAVWMNREGRSVSGGVGGALGHLNTGYRCGRVVTKVTAALVILTP